MVAAAVVTAVARALVLPAVAPVVVASGVAVVMATVTSGLASTTLPMADGATRAAAASALGPPGRSRSPMTASGASTRLSRSCARPLRDCSLLPAETPPEVTASVTPHASEPVALPHMSCEAALANAAPVTTVESTVTLTSELCVTTNEVSAVWPRALEMEAESAATEGRTEEDPTSMVSIVYVAYARGGNGGGGYGGGGDVVEKISPRSSLAERSPMATPTATATMATIPTATAIIKQRTFLRCCFTSPFSVVTGWVTVPGNIMVLFGEASGDGSDRRPGDIDPTDGSRVEAGFAFSPGLESLVVGSVRARDELFKEKLFSSYALEKLASLSDPFFFGGPAVDIKQERPARRSLLCFACSHATGGSGGKLPVNLGGSARRRGVPKEMPKTNPIY